MAIKKWGKKNKAKVKLHMTNKEFMNKIKV